MTPEGLVVLLPISALVALARISPEGAGRAGSEAETRRVRKRMRDYRDEWMARNAAEGAGRQGGDDP